MFTTDPKLALPMLDFMATRISELVELVADLSLHTVTARLARLLLEQAQDDLIQRRSWAPSRDGRSLGDGTPCAQPRFAYADRSRVDSSAVPPDSDP